MIKAAQTIDRRNLLLVDGLLLAVCFSAMADLRLFPHSAMGTAALASIAMTSIIGSAILQWKLLTEGPA